MARPVKVLSASDDVRAELRRRARGQANEHRERFRAGIILLRLNGVSIKDVAARMNTSTRTVSISSSRFERSGLAGLTEVGRGRRPSLPREQGRAGHLRGDTPAQGPPALECSQYGAPCRHVSQHGSAHLGEE